MPVTQLSDFLPAIRAEPDNDEPRLVAADWLEDQGDPASLTRAELIRLQVQIVLEARKPSEAENRRIQILMEIIRCSQFHIPEQRSIRGSKHSAFIRRGFVQEMRGTPKGLLDATEMGVFEHNPVETLVCNQTNRKLRKLLAVLQHDGVIEHTNRIELNLEDAATMAIDETFPTNPRTLRVHAESITQLCGIREILRMQKHPKILEIAVRQYASPRDVCHSALNDYVRTVAMPVVVVVQRKRDTMPQSPPMSIQLNEHLYYQVEYGRDLSDGEILRW